MYFHLVYISLIVLTTLFSQKILNDKINEDQKDMVSFIYFCYLAFDCFLDFIIHRRN